MASIWDVKGSFNAKNFFYEKHKGKYNFTFLNEDAVENRDSWERKEQKNLKTGGKPEGKDNRKRQRIGWHYNVALSTLEQQNCGSKKVDRSSKSKEKGEQSAK